MEKKLKISIITVCYNSVDTISTSIQSVLSQDYLDVEYIIIDGSSNDGTINIIRSFLDQIDYFISEEDKGIYDAMNKGILHATGDIVGILNSDDFYSSDNVLTQVANTFNTFDCDSVYSDLVYVKYNNISKIVRYWKSGLFSIAKLKRGWMLPHPTFFLRRELYDKYGLYNTELKSAADYEMILRLLYKYNITVRYIPKILVNMRQGGVSNSSLWNRIKANKEDLLAWKINQLYQPYFIRLKKPLIKIKQYFLRPDTKASV